ncbi:MATE family efflux transporter, partial [bacterium]|nr:MATE family efflux transporter [bacterium]
MSGDAPRGRRDLRSGSIPRRLVELSAPMLLGIVAIMAFNLVDTFYVSRLGTLQLAAISFTFPVVVLVGGLTLGLGVGLTAIVSQEIGAGQLERVRQFTRDGLLLALLVVAVFSAAGL